MDCSVIENFVIGELQDARKENAELRGQIAELRTKLSEAYKDCMNEEAGEGQISMPTLGCVYHTGCYRWVIKRDNIEKYREALANKDFDWLCHNDYRVDTVIYNYNLVVLGKVIHLCIANDYGKLTATQIDPKASGHFETCEEAQDALLAQLREDIEAAQKAFDKEDARIAAEKSAEQTAN